MNQTGIFSHLKDVLNRHSNLKLDFTVPFHQICFDEGATQSVTGVNQWFAYLRVHHVPTAYHDINHFETRIIFGGKGKQNVNVAILGRVNIRAPLPGFTYFDFSSLLIVNYVPMLFGFATQIRLRTITERRPELTAYLGALDVFIPLVFMSNHLYYVSDCNNDFLFSSTELEQIHRNFGHAPPGSIYSELHRTYPVEIGATDLKNLEELTKSCKVCQLHTKTSQADTERFFRTNACLISKLQWTSC